MYYGFIIILLAWMWQWYKSGHGQRRMDDWFLRLFALGLIVVIFDTFELKNFLSWASILTLVIVLLFVRKVRH
jgi:uncharacterized membrane protein